MGGGNLYTVNYKYNTILVNKMQVNIKIKNSIYFVKKLYYNVNNERKLSNVFTKN